MLVITFSPLKRCTNKFKVVALAVFKAMGHHSAESHDAFTVKQLSKG